MDHTKIVVVGSDPCATRVVSTAMSHGIRTFGELFNRHHGATMEQHASARVLICVGQDPISFLDEQVYGDGVPTAFTLLSNQARSVAWSRVWSYVRRNCRIIIVKEDLLANIARDGHVDPCEFRARAIKMLAIHKDLDEYFSSSDKVIINQYETMELGRFLGMDIQPVGRDVPRVENRSQLVADNADILEQLKWML